MPHILSKELTPTFLISKQKDSGSKKYLATMKTCSSMFMLFYFNTQLDATSMTSKCVQLSFGGGHVVSARQGEPYLCLKKKGVKRDNRHRRKNGCTNPCLI